MAKKFSKLKAKLPPNVQKRINTKANVEVKRLLTQMPLHKLEYHQSKYNQS